MMKRMAICCLMLVLASGAYWQPVLRAEAVSVSDVTFGNIFESFEIYMTPYDGDLYFRADGETGSGNQLWRYSGSGDPAPVLGASVGTDSEKRFEHLEAYNGDLYFGHDGGDGSGPELWKYNSSTGFSINPVADIRSGAVGSRPFFLKEFDNKIYFCADGGSGAGLELWRYDPVNGAALADDINTAGFSAPQHQEVFGGMLYFTANGDSAFGRELYRTPAADESSVLVSDAIRPGPVAGQPEWMAEFNSELYFSANDGTGTTLWKYSGTGDPVEAFGVINPRYLTEFDGALYFSAEDGSGDNELWKFDGTTASRVEDINPIGDSNPSNLTVFNNALYFHADDASGTKLFKLGVIPEPSSALLAGLGLFVLSLMRRQYRPSR